MPMGILFGEYIPFSKYISIDLFMFTIFYQTSGTYPASLFTYRGYK